MSLPQKTVFYCLVGSVANLVVLEREQRTLCLSYLPVFKVIPKSTYTVIVKVC